MMGHLGNPRVQCSICRHEERARAELLLAKGDAIAVTARKFAMSVDALGRHWRAHVSEEQRAVLAIGGKALAAKDELAAQVAEENTSVLDHLKAERAGLWRRFIAELEAGNSTVLAVVAAQLTKVNATIARLTGELASSQLIQQTNLHVHFTQDREFIGFVQELAEALGPFPEARRAVFAKLEELERQEAEPLGAEIALPQLEHQGDGAAT